NQLDVEGGDRARPRDAVLVRLLLDRRRGDPGRTYPVRAHPDQLLLARLVQIRRVERLRVAGPQLEDVADLDRRLDPNLAAVDMVARLDAAKVGLLEAEVAPRG